MKKSLLFAAMLTCTVTLFQSSAVAQAGIIEGTVVNTSGGKPEAGVWVIAETKSLPTPYRKIVVTNDAGKFVVPDLPKGEYEVWVRGYGLKDSSPAKAVIGKSLKLEVASAATPQEAAKIYPANYWLSLYQLPTLDQVPAQFGSADQWVAQFKLNCMLCHQIGGQPVRQHTTPEEFDAAWKLATSMENQANNLGHDALAKSLGDWGKRIADGEVPQAPPRPAGIERNVVVTQWQWGREDSYMHDEVSTDKRNPTLYPYGKVYGADYGQDFLWALDPKTNEVTSHKVPTTNVRTTRGGDWSVLNNPAHPHNPMMDDKGNVWITTQIRPGDKMPSWSAQVVAVKSESERASAEKLMAAKRTGHNLAYWDTSKNEFVQVDTAYSTHHLQFDAQGRLWTSLDSTVLGMFDPSKFDPKNPRETESKAQKAWMAIDPNTGRATSGGGYGIAVNPVDQTIWRANFGAGGPAPGSPARAATPVPTAVPQAAPAPGGGTAAMQAGARPAGGGGGEFAGGSGNTITKFDPKNQTFTRYDLPMPARGPRGIDMTTDGIVWSATGSGHLVRFDPKAEQFKVWELPAPKMKGAGMNYGNTEMPYYIWVDQFDTFGMGKDMVISTGTNSDSLIVFNPATEKFTVLRVPYPLGFFHRGLDGRIDDAKAGWKGRGLWVDYGIDPVRFIEDSGMSQLVHVQLRPDPLAR